MKKFPVVSEIPPPPIRKVSAELLPETGLAFVATSTPFRYTRTPFVPSATAARWFQRLFSDPSQGAWTAPVPGDQNSIVVGLMNPNSATSFWPNRPIRFVAWLAVWKNHPDMLNAVCPLSGEMVVLT